MDIETGMEVDIEVDIEAGIEVDLAVDTAADMEVEEAAGEGDRAAGDEADGFLCY